ncbi:MAG: hypothetical protein ACREP2_07740 [Rhodanobacteraceae bacterium]
MVKKLLRNKFRKFLFLRERPPRHGVEKLISQPTGVPVDVRKGTKIIVYNQSVNFCSLRALYVSKRFLARHSGAPAASSQANPESMLLSRKDHNGLTRAILGARATRRLRRSRLQSCKRSRVPPANSAGGPGMTTSLLTYDANQD